MSPSDILIAEDAISVAQELKEVLERLGYRVVDIVSSGAEALRKASNLQPDIILMNIRLKGRRDGIQTGSLLRTLHDMPVVYVVDSTGQETIRRATTTGPFGYVFRPFDEKQIYATIETALSRHHLERELRRSKQWLNTTLRSIGEGVIATDEHGLVCFMNPIAMEITGWHQEEAIGRSLYEVFVFVDESSHDVLDLSEIKNTKTGADLEKGLGGLLLPRSGPPVPVEANATAIQDEIGQVYGMVLVFRDVIQQRAALQEIKRQATRAEALMQVASQLNTQLELETVLSTICEIMNRTIPPAGAAVVLLDAAARCFRVMASTSQEPELQAYLRASFEIPKERLQSLLSREQPVQVLQNHGALSNSQYWQALEKTQIQTLALAALFQGTTVTGALILAFTEQAKAIPDDEIALFRGLADQASNAIQNAELFRQLRAGRERQRKLAKSLVDIQEAERRHIAKELHDHLGQVLTGMQFTLETTKNQASGVQHSNLEEIQNTVRDIIRQVREMSLNLRPSMLDDMGLQPTVLWHVDRYTAQTGIRVTLQCGEFPGRLPLEIETAAYRIVQEALTNVARHAQVSEASVSLVVKDHTLWVDVSDKGRGFDPAVECDKPSSGLGGMRERANMVGGYLVVKSAIQQGTRLLVALPLSGQPLERRDHGRNCPASR